MAGASGGGRGFTNQGHPQVQSGKGRWEVTTKQERQLDELRGMWISGLVLLIGAVRRGDFETLGTIHAGVFDLMLHGADLCKAIASESKPRKKTKKASKS
jgi:hypothetical protein